MKLPAFLSALTGTNSELKKFETDVAALESSLAAVTAERDAHAAQIATLKEAADKLPTVEAQVTELTDKLASAEALAASANAELAKAQSAIEEAKTVTIEKVSAAALDKVASLGIPANDLPAPAAEGENAYNKWQELKGEAATKFYQTNKAAILASWPK
jgi:chromosome segregation ATPase